MNLLAMSERHDTIYPSRENSSSSNITSSDILAGTDTPETQRLYDLWYRRFQEFKVKILWRSLTETPAGYQIEHFLFWIVDSVDPEALELSSFDWLSRGFGCVDVSLSRHHPEYALSQQERLGIDSVFTTLLEHGRIDHERRMPRQENKIWPRLFAPTNSSTHPSYSPMYPSYKPRRCTVMNCKSPTVFKTSMTYRAHLVKRHDITDRERDEHHNAALHREDGI